MEFVGWMFDVAREQSPSEQFLEDVLSRSGQAGYNAVGLYLEHRFAYPSAPWAAAPGCLTPEVARRLTERFGLQGLRIIPFLNTLGHMEGFLRSETALIQTIGRAARHISGQVTMYADEVTNSMRRAIDETDRRRRRQVEYNEECGIEPQSVRKAIRDLLVEQVAEEPALYGTDEGGSGKPLTEVIAELEYDMRLAAQELRFDEAAKIRDHIRSLQGDVSEPVRPRGRRQARKRRKA